MKDITMPKLSPTINLIDPRGGYNRYGCDIDFFKQWTDEMAYVLGFLYADGNITDAVSSRTQYIKFVSADKDILDKIRRAMKSEHPLSIQPPRLCVHENGLYKSATVFTLRIGSRIMSNDLIRLGVIPNKSRIVCFPDVPHCCLNHFIRGYFDGDGCVSISRARNKVGFLVIKRLSVIFTSGSFVFLEQLGRILKSRLFLHQERVYENNRAFQLRYSTNDSTEIFKFLYKSCIRDLYLKRKFDIFTDYFKLFPGKIDTEISTILRSFA